MTPARPQRDKEQGYIRSCALFWKFWAHAPSQSASQNRLRFPEKEEEPTRKYDVHRDKKYQPHDKRAESDRHIAQRIPRPATEERAKIVWPNPQIGNSGVEKMYPVDDIRSAHNDEAYPQQLVFE